MAILSYYTVCNICFSIKNKKKPFQKKGFLIELFQYERNILKEIEYYSKLFSHKKVCGINRLSKSFCTLFSSLYRGQLYVSGYSLSNNK